MSYIDKLRELEENMKPWEKKPVLKAGKIIVEIVKLPEKKTKSTARPAHLAVLVRKEDAFRGILLESMEELEDLKIAVGSEKLEKIIEAIEQLMKEKRVVDFEL